MASTLAERFRRAIVSDDLATAKAVAKRAFQATANDAQPFDIRNETVSRSRHNHSSSFLSSSKSSYPVMVTSSSDGDNGKSPNGAGAIASSSKALLEHSHDVQVLALTGPCDFLPALSATQHQLAQEQLKRDKHKRSGQCKSSLMLAIEMNASIELVQWLLDMGHEKHSYSRDARNCTMVSLAAQHNRTDIIEALCTEAIANAASMHHERALALERGDTIRADYRRYYEDEDSLDYGKDDKLIRRGSSYRTSDESDMHRPEYRGLVSASRDETDKTQREKGLPEIPLRSRSSGETGARSTTLGHRETENVDSGDENEGDGADGDDDYDDDDEEALSRELSRLIDSQDNLGRTALALASMKGYQEVVSQLIEVGANVDLADLEGNSPLHYAAAYNHILVVQLLIEKGCSFASKNSFGSTAADYAYTTSLKGALEAFARAKFDRGRRDQDSTSPVLYRVKNTVLNPVKSMQVTAQQRLASQLRDLHF